MKNRIGFIAVGQAGSNISMLFEKKGYQVLYLNTSQEDLDLVKGKYTYKITNGEGCNKNRRKAKQLIIDDFDNVFKEIKSKLSADIYYIVFASGGGTSGAAPMLADLLIGEGNKIGLITILPSKDESIKTQLNSYETFKEIDDIENLCSCFILDNEGQDKMSINNEFVNIFNSFVTIPERHKSTKGNIDKAEIIETLSTPGMSMILSGKDDMLISKFDENIYAPREDDAIVKYITASLSGKMTIKDIERKIGIAFDNFKTYNEDKTICCISGLSYPLTRLDEIYETIDINKENVKKSLDVTKKSCITKDVNFFDEDIKSKKKKEDTVIAKSKKDIMNKYLK